MKQRAVVAPMGEAEVVSAVVRYMTNTMERMVREQGLTTQQVADVLLVSGATVKRWCNEGRLQCIRLPGRHRRITVASVSAFTRGTTVPAAIPQNKESE